MSILIHKETRVICQGITGKAGAFHTKDCLDYGTKMVGGVTPGKGGTNDPNGLPIFNTVREAVKATGADASISFVPAPFAADAIMEAADAGIAMVVSIAEGVPVLDMVRLKEFLKGYPQTRLLGCNCPGMITVGECKMGIMPSYIFTPAWKAKSGKSIGMISKSGTLTFETVFQCGKRGIGQTTSVGVGGDPVKGTNFVDALKMFNEDTQSDAIVMIGEIGGTDEESAADFVKKHVKKPVIAYVAGRTAPAGRRMGHAGAIIMGGEGTHATKVAALKAAGIHVAQSAELIGETVARALGV